jgi:hypothetical protein
VHALNDHWSITPGLFDPLHILPGHGRLSELSPDIRIRHRAAIIEDDIFKLHRTAIGFKTCQPRKMAHHLGPKFGLFLQIATDGIHGLHTGMPYAISCHRSINGQNKRGVTRLFCSFDSPKRSISAPDEVELIPARALRCILDLLKSCAGKCGKGYDGSGFADGFRCDCLTPGP